MTTLNSQIRTRIDAFVAELSDLLHQSAVEAAVDALKATAASGHTALAPTAKRSGSAAARKAAAGRAIESLVAASTGASSRPVGKARKSVRGQARSSKQVAATAQTLLAYVKAHPAERSENIRKALRLERPVMAAAVKQLIAEKRLASKGEKRATTYSAI